eukprot:TRINITY_DN1280_c0_g1_i1.p1 TRINITY_DN1280_c0_g1~~TRINITY_DN1280_c0_g1_i1.p1  ORF type:complete len:402 (+),score=47.28 TRINITY_DN1280_c0_g1_i1:420-1625(+)
MNVFAVVIVVAILLLGPLAIYCFIESKKKRNLKPQAVHDLYKDVELSFPGEEAKPTQPSNDTTSQTLGLADAQQDKETIFSWEMLVQATNNFHEDHRIGEGSFASVFKGILQDCKMIAVKMLKIQPSRGDQEFMNEVELLTKVQHRNLVTLLGCCKEGDKRLLVYEYMPHNSLEKIIFDQNKRKELDWNKRRDIISGVASGLSYLHEDSKLKIVHRDIKASNILLDDKLNPKIADFGFAKHFPDDKSHTQSKLVGTIGYIAPEYVREGHISVKTDVFSFGVLTLEIISGRSYDASDLPEDMRPLLKWAWRLYQQKAVWNMVDETIKLECNRKEIERFIHVALVCTQEDPSQRPSMFRVRIWLTKCEGDLPQPTMPAFAIWQSCPEPRDWPSGIFSGTRVHT